MCRGCLKVVVLPVSSLLQTALVFLQPALTEHACSAGIGEPAPKDALTR